MTSATHPARKPNADAYCQQVDALITRNRDLNDRARALLFPPSSGSFLRSLNVTNWSMPRLLLYCYSQPFSWYTLIMDSDVPNKWCKVSAWAGTMLLLVAPVFWFVGADQTLEMLFSGSRLYIHITPGFLIILLGLLLSAASYANWYNFWRDSRNPLGFRLLWNGLYLAVAVSMPWWGFDAPIRAQLHRLQEGGGMILALVAIYVLFLLPFITWFFAGGVELLRTVLGFLVIAVTHPLNFHKTNDGALLRKLVAHPIPPSEGDRPSWSLAEVSETELDLLCSWAQAGQEATDRRFQPTILILSVLQIALIGELVTNILENTVGDFLRSLPAGWTLSELPAAIPFHIQVLFLALLMFVAVPVAGAILNLLQYAATQSLIIEACTVARHARALSLTPSPPPATFFSRLQRLISKL